MWASPCAWTFFSSHTLVDGINTAKYYSTAACLLSSIFVLVASSLVSFISGSSNLTVAIFSFYAFPAKDSTGIFDLVFSAPASSGVSCKHGLFTLEIKGLTRVIRLSWECSTLNRSHFSSLSLWGSSLCNVSFCPSLLSLFPFIFHLQKAIFSVLSVLVFQRNQAFFLYWGFSWVRSSMLSWPIVTFGCVAIFLLGCSVILSFGFVWTFSVHNSYCSHEYWVNQWSITQVTGLQR